MAHRPGLQVFRSLWGCDSHLPFRALESIGERLSLLKVCVCVWLMCGALVWCMCAWCVRVRVRVSLPLSFSLSLSLFVSPFTLDSLTDQLTNDHPSPSLYPLPLPSPSTPSL